MANKFMETNEKIAEAVVEGNKKIADGVTEGFKKIEDGVVGGFTKIEDDFVGKFLTHEGESVEDAKKRLQYENAEHQAAQKAAEEKRRAELEEKTGIHH